MTRLHNSRCREVCPCPTPRGKSRQRLCLHSSCPSPPLLCVSPPRISNTRHATLPLDPTSTWTVQRRSRSRRRRKPSKPCAEPAFMLCDLTRRRAQSVGEMALHEQLRNKPPSTAHFKVDSRANIGTDWKMPRSGTVAFSVNFSSTEACAPPPPPLFLCPHLFRPPFADDRCLRAFALHFKARSFLARGSYSSLRSGSQTSSMSTRGRKEATAQKPQGMQGRRFHKRNDSCSYGHRSGVASSALAAMSRWVMPGGVQRLPRQLLLDQNRMHPLLCHDRFEMLHSSPVNTVKYGVISYYFERKKFPIHAFNTDSTVRKLQVTVGTRGKSNHRRPPRCWYILRAQFSLRRASASKGWV